MTNTHKLIGPAGYCHDIISQKIRLGLTRPLKLLFHGDPGTGKTDCARRLADLAAGHKLGVEHVNGKNVTVDVVREWQYEAHGTSLFGNIAVKLIDEFDRCSRDAQDLMLTYLDDIKPYRAVIATTNLALDGKADDGKYILPRLSSRFQCYHFVPPKLDDIARFISREFGIVEPVAVQLARGADGNVRAAMLDAEAWLDAQAAQKAA